MRNYASLSRNFKEAFQINTSPVAIHISERPIAGNRPSVPSLFCELVRKTAYTGEIHVIGADDLSNFSTRVILGYREPQYVDLYPRVKPAKTKSIVVAPLEKIEIEPDVVVVITDPAHAMLVVQALTKSLKKPLEASMTCHGGAIAGEAVAIPFMEHRPNLTLLCGGARELAGYSPNELALGLPFADFLKLVDSLAIPV
ncbi:MAG: DUF169 domain-containing protein [Candidatus Hadarchaeum sp.]|uniref:DUF169 domain-containing protein n=1 Tax=Candidatus Hadarchaeum sp. TaxID=2883567 RepID=UPI003D09A7DF